MESVGVFARIRPRATDEPADPSVVVKRRFDQQRTVQVRNLEFSLDWVFDADAAQEDVYDFMGRDRVARVGAALEQALEEMGGSAFIKLSTHSAKDVRFMRSAEHPSWIPFIMPPQIALPRRPIRCALVADSAV